ncbi:alpha-ribazole phosphatase [Desulfotruncus alcoholivorax]|uniref:alpha-ribazole phosphatase n=1 Tax=Desulfotruncus alcoholivorax TaxID=265477 RepID=UPI0004032FF5|nr:alpha-ribazole phosphatase [Desulfotruncus alcoholivorax]
MGCRILLIRHGETVWNKEAKLQGQTDIPLSEKGIQQAVALSKRLSDRKIEAVYASSLSRAIRTAGFIAEPHHRQVQILPDLQELNFGNWEGLTFKEIQQNYSELSKTWWSKPLETRIPGGETLDELAKRSNRAIKDIVLKHNDQTVAVVAHGGTIRSIVGTVLGIDLNQYWKLRQDNASLSIVYFHGWDKGILELYNDCSHLETV